MQYFKFEIRDRSGKRRYESIIADKEQEGANLFRLDPDDLIKAVKMSDFEVKCRFALTKKKVPLKDKIVFYRGVADFIRNNKGRHLIDALPMIAASIKSPIGKGLCVSIGNMMSREGLQSLSAALGRFPESFSQYDIYMVKTGDDTGNLQQTLTILADQCEEWLSVNRKIKKAAMYPTIALSIGLALGSLMIFKLVPDLLGNFIGMTQSLPAYILILYGITLFMQAFWYYFVPIPIICVILIMVSYKKVLAKDSFQRGILKVPVIGTMLHKMYLARSLSALSMFLRSSKTDSDALPVVQKLCENRQYKDFYGAVTTGINNGLSLPSSFMKAKHLIGSREGAIIASQLELGQQSGDLNGALINIVKERETDVSEYADLLPEIIPPIMLIVMAIGASVILIPVFMAIFDISSSM